MPRGKRSGAKHRAKRPTAEEAFQAAAEEGAKLVTQTTPSSSPVHRTRSTTASASASANTSPLKESVANRLSEHNRIELQERLEEAAIDQAIDEALVEEEESNREDGETVPEDDAVDSAPDEESTAAEGEEQASVEETQPTSNVSEFGQYACAVGARCAVPHNPGTTLVRCPGCNKQVHNTCGVYDQDQQLAKSHWCFACWDIHSALEAKNKASLAELFAGGNTPEQKQGQSNKGKSPKKSKPKIRINLKGLGRKKGDASEDVDEQKQGGKKGPKSPSKQKSGKRDRHSSGEEDEGPLKKKLQVGDDEDSMDTAYRADEFKEEEIASGGTTTILAVNEADERSHDSSSTDLLASVTADAVMATDSDSEKKSPAKKSPGKKSPARTSVVKPKGKKGSSPAKSKKPNDKSGKKASSVTAHAEMDAEMATDADSQKKSPGKKSPARTSSGKPKGQKGSSPAKNKKPNDKARKKASKKSTTASSPSPRSSKGKGKSSTPKSDGYESEGAKSTPQKQSSKSPDKPEPRWTSPRTRSGQSPRNESPTSKKGGKKGQSPQKESPASKTGGKKVLWEPKPPSRRKAGLPARRGKARRKPGKKPSRQLPIATEPDETEPVAPDETQKPKISRLKVGSRVYKVDSSHCYFDSVGRILVDGVHYYVDDDKRTFVITSAVSTTGARRTVLTRQYIDLKEGERAPEATTNDGDLNEDVPLPRRAEPKELRDEDDRQLAWSKAFTQLPPVIPFVGDPDLSSDSDVTVFSGSDLEEGAAEKYAQRQHEFARDLKEFVNNQYPPDLDRLIVAEVAGRSAATSYYKDDPLEYRESTVEEEKALEDLMGMNLKSDHKFAAVGKRVVTFESFQRMDHGQWLNDECVDYMIRAFNVWYPVTAQPGNCSIFATDLMSMLCPAFFPEMPKQFTYKRASNLISLQLNQKSIFEMEKLIFLRNENNYHWVLYVVFPRKHRIEVLDSIATASAYIDNLAEVTYLYFLLYEYTLKLHPRDKKHFGGPKQPRWEWIPRWPACPRQHDGSSCGVFMLAFALAVALDRNPFSVSQHTCTELRTQWALKMKRGEQEVECTNWDLPTDSVWKLTATERKMIRKDKEKREEIYHTKRKMRQKNSVELPEDVGQAERLQLRSTLRQDALEVERAKKNRSSRTQIRLKTHKDSVANRKTAIQNKARRLWRKMGLGNMYKSTADKERRDRQKLLDTVFHEGLFLLTKEERKIYEEETSKQAKKFDKQELKEIQEIGAISFRPGTSGKECPFGEENALIEGMEGVYFYNTYSVRFANRNKPDEHNINPEWVKGVFNEIFMEVVKMASPNFVWIPIGNARDPGDVPPPSIVTSIPVTHIQADNDYCLTYGMASCLAYLGLGGVGGQLCAQAGSLKDLPGDAALRKVAEFVRRNVPSVGDCLTYNMKTRKHRRIPRTMTVDDLIEKPDEFPTLVILRATDGAINHSIAVVDDLIFDSTQKFALRLCRESLDWICGDGGVECIHAAMKFCKKHGTSEKWSHQFTRHDD